MVCEQTGEYAMDSEKGKSKEQIISEYWKPETDRKKRKKQLHFINFLPKAKMELEKRGFYVQQLNHEGHWRIDDYDYWPTSGTFIHRTSGRKGKGLDVLIKLLEVI